MIICFSRKDLTYNAGSEVFSESWLREAREGLRWILALFAGILSDLIGIVAREVADYWLTLVPMIIGGLLIDAEAADFEAVRFDTNGVLLLGILTPDSLPRSEGLVVPRLDGTMLRSDICMAAAVSFLMKLVPGEGIVTGLYLLVTGG